MRGTVSDCYRRVIPLFTKRCLLCVFSVTLDSDADALLITPTCHLKIAQSRHCNFIGNKPRRQRGLCHADGAQSLCLESAGLKQGRAALSQATFGHLTNYKGKRL